MENTKKNVENVNAVSASANATEVVVATPTKRNKRKLSDLSKEELIAKIAKMQKVKKDKKAKVEVEKPKVEKKKPTKAKVQPSEVVQPKTKKAKVQPSEKPMKENLATLVAKECKKNVSRTKDEGKLLHHEICGKLQNLAEQSGFPIGVLVYVTIGTSAHKPSVFAEGYAKFEEERGKRIIKMCNAFAKHFSNDKIKSNDRLVHALCAFDNAKGIKGKAKLYKECLARLDNSNGIKMSKFKTAKDLLHYIFADTISYNERGYLD